MIKYKAMSAANISSIGTSSCVERTLEIAKFTFESQFLNNL